MKSACQVAVLLGTQHAIGKASLAEGTATGAYNSITISSTSTTISRISNTSTTISNSNSNNNTRTNKTTSNQSHPSSRSHVATASPRDAAKKVLSATRRS